MKDITMSTKNYYFQNFISALTYYLLGLGYAFARDWINKDRKSLKLEKEIAQAELTLLRNQLNPHFLFNTINNINHFISSKKMNGSEYFKRYKEENRRA